MLRARLRNPAALAVLVLAVPAASGCRFGEASFASTVPERAFDPAGTVFTYLDEHDDNLVVDDNPRVAVSMTWIMFDPNGDLNDLEGSALEDYTQELKLRDALSLVFDELGAIENGAEFQSVLVGSVETGSGALRSRVHLAPERLSATSTYGDVVPLASRRTTTVTITADNLGEASPVLAGDVTIAFERTEDDPGAALEGTFTGTFTAPVVSERTAEQNLSLLDVTEVLGLPLAPRAVLP